MQRIELTQTILQCFWNTISSSNEQTTSEKLIKLVLQNQNKNVYSEDLVKKLSVGHNCVSRCGKKLCESCELLVETFEKVRQWSRLAEQTWEYRQMVRELAPQLNKFAKQRLAL